MFNKIPDKVNYIIAKLIKNNYKAYLCGGAVRDLVMGIEPKDFDITTSATPEQVKEVFKKDQVTFIDTGIEFGSIIINVDEDLYDVTTFRADGKYSDSRRPDNITYSTEAKEDVVRRDFTINGLVYNKYEGIVDLVGGLEDIENGVIRAIGDPKERFKEDNLRILRAIRFALRYGFNIEEHTLQAMGPFIDNLKVSKERIYKELKEILINLYKIHDNKDRNIIFNIIARFIINADSDIWRFIDLMSVANINEKYRGDLEASLIMLFSTRYTLFKEFDDYIKSGNSLGIETKYIKVIKEATVIRSTIRFLVAGGDSKEYRMRKLLRYHKYEDIVRVIKIFYDKEISSYLINLLNLLNKSIDKFKVLAIDGEDIKKEFNIEAGLVIGECLNYCEHYVLEDIENNNREFLLNICKKVIENKI